MIPCRKRDLFLFGVVCLLGCGSMACSGRTSQARADSIARSEAATSEARAVDPHSLRLTPAAGTSESGAAPETKGAVDASGEAALDDRACQPSLAIVDTALVLEWSGTEAESAAIQDHVRRLASSINAGTPTTLISRPVFTLVEPVPLGAKLTLLPQDALHLDVLVTEVQALVDGRARELAVTPCSAR